ncbi:uncharacterized protein LOC109599890 [Aethina tumida]|uniref:uncharacterized protein LOC109599890 n=1 Tax=Aethina tumida TaxID=116153 RepID=UPI0021498A41|nr:uncharacterized protein LOC109599890 [Aethina tumida]
MCRSRAYSNVMDLLQPKNEDTNLVSATFHMFTITLICMSMVDLQWFTISGNVCVPYLTLGQFFWFKYQNYPMEELICVTSVIVNVMRVTIVLCFVAIIFALFGFITDIVGSKKLVHRLLRRYAVPGTCTVLWIMAIISLSYYVIFLLEDSLSKHFAKSYFSVTYGVGFYLLASAGVVSSIGIIYNWVLANHPSSYQREDDVCILDGSDNDLDTFNSPTPPPPYNMPPPPYSP